LVDAIEKLDAGATAAITLKRDQETALKITLGSITDQILFSPP
jgi:hypothetical protein